MSSADRDPEDNALEAVQQIILALNALAETQKSLCDVGLQVVEELRAGNKLRKAEQKKSPARGP